MGKTERKKKSERKTENQRHPKWEVSVCNIFPFFGQPQSDSKGKNVTVQ